MNVMQRRFVSIALCIVLQLSCMGCSRKQAAPSDDSGAKSAPDEVVISSHEQAAQNIQVTTASLSEAPHMLRFPGHIALPDNAMWRVGVLTEGRVEKVYANLGDYVRKGQVIARMHSHDVHEARAAYQVAVSEHARLESAQTLAQKEYDRTQRLYTLKAASLEQTEMARQELVNAQAATHNADIDVTRERTHLEDTLGIPADVPANSHGEDNDLVPILAPASGYVLQKNVTPGATIQTTTDAFVIGDLHHLWMLASVGVDKLSQLHPGQSAFVSLPDMPGQSFPGKVTNLGQEFDTTTRQMQIRIELENNDNRLRPEMLAKADLPI